MLYPVLFVFTIEKGKKCVSVFAYLKKKTKKNRQWKIQMYLAYIYIFILKYWFRRNSFVFFLYSLQELCSIFLSILVWRSVWWVRMLCLRVIRSAKTNPIENEPNKLTVGISKHIVQNSKLQMKWHT